jgi:very-short-patch-repair endonuclease
VAQAVPDAGWALMTDQYTEAALHWLGGHIEWAMSKIGAECGSPIETGLLKALVALRLVDRRLRLDGLPSGPLATEWEATVYPQHIVDPYRVDFAVHVTASSSGQSLSAWIAVECDGHDFHERTKEQAARDKARDRHLVKCGFRVLRFTGSEIHGNNMKCALQIMEIAESIYAEWSETLRPQIVA